MTDGTEQGSIERRRNSPSREHVDCDRTASWPSSRGTSKSERGTTSCTRGEAGAIKARKGPYNTLDKRTFSVVDDGTHEPRKHLPLTICIASSGGNAISKLTPNPFWFCSAPVMLALSGMKRPVRYSIDRVTASPSVLVAADSLKRR